MTRRTVLSTGLAAGVLTVGAPPLADTAGASDRQDPFTLGVASGDPWPTGVVIWTRLAREPLAPDGLGGMPRMDVAVRWQVAEDERFRRVVRHGRSVARPRDAHTVHVEVEGLLLEVVDDGVGFDTTAPSPPDRFGLRGLRSLVRDVGGELDVTSALGEGTSVRMAVRR